jgi:hypothetical protein
VSLPPSSLTYDSLIHPWIFPSTHMTCKTNPHSWLLLQKFWITTTPTLLSLTSFNNNHSCQKPLKLPNSKFCQFLPIHPLATILHQRISTHYSQNLASLNSHPFKVPHDTKQQHTHLFTLLQTNHNACKFKWEQTLYCSYPQKTPINTTPSQLK